METHETPIRLLVADTEDLFRTGLPSLVSRDGGMTVVAQASTAPEACDKARRTQPDVALIGIDLPDGGGLSVAQMLQRERPEARVALIGRSFARAELQEGMRAGVIGYITKDVAVPTLMDALRCVARGDAIATSSAAALLVDETALRAPIASPGSLVVPQPVDHPELTAVGAKVTEREREVLNLIVQGATNRDIAARLLITENTVKVHLRNILDKLNLRNRQQAAAFAVSSGLVAMGEGELVHRGREKSEPGHRTAGSWRRRECLR